MSASAQKAVQLERIDSEGVVREGSSSKRRILLVDEQAHVLRVMRLNLDRLGYLVDTAVNSENALLLLRKHRYDALIMTSDMPDMSTQQLCENATRDCGTTVPLMLISGGGDDSWVDASSIVERLDKPVSLRWIVARLGEVFG